MNKVFEYMGWDKIIDCDTCDLEYCQGSNLPIPECRFQKNGNDMVQAINVMQENGDWEKYNLFMAQLEFGNSPEVEGIDWSGMIDVAYVENSTDLLREAVEFLE